VTLEIPQVSLEMCGPFRAVSLQWQSSYLHRHQFDIWRQTFSHHFEKHQLLLSIAKIVAYLSSILTCLYLLLYLPDCYYGSSQRHHRYHPDCSASACLSCGRHSIANLGCCWLTCRRTDWQNAVAAWLVRGKPAGSVTLKAQIALSHQPIWWAAD